MNVISDRDDEIVKNESRASTLPFLAVFIDHRNVRAVKSVNNLRRQLRALGLDPGGLVVFDVLEHTEEAERYRVLATPTLIRLDGGMNCRLVGSFNNPDLLLAFLTSLT